MLDVGEDTVTLSAAGSTFEFASEAEAVLRPLVDGRTVDLATLTDTAGLTLGGIAGLVQELARLVEVVQEVRAWAARAAASPASST
ncbi:winged helix domain-containing protein [Streptomyces olivaceoviridis]